MICLGGDFHNTPRFDEFLGFDDAQMEAIANLFEAELSGDRTRARSAKDVDVFRRTLALVIANALVGGEAGVHYSRYPGTYNGLSPYKPSWLGFRHLTGIIDGLEQLSLVWALRGEWRGCFVKGVQSSFGSKPYLIEVLARIGIGRDDVRKDTANAPVILMKTEDDRALRYDPHEPTTAQLISEVRTLNEFIAAQQFELAGVPTDAGTAFLTRVFNNGQWDLGGRFFGGWWQLVSSVERATIRINGEPTMELDFGGFFPRALYHLNGLDVPGEDPYDIPAVRSFLEAYGIPWKLAETPLTSDEDAKPPTGRKAVKVLLNVAISAKSRKALTSDKTLKKVKLPPEVVSECWPHIEAHHPHLKGKLFKGKSLQLMNLEAAICHDVLMDGWRENIVILPVHDSFIAQTKHSDFLSTQMILRYRERLGYTPTIHN